MVYCVHPCPQGFIADIGYFLTYEFTTSSLLKVALAPRAVKHSYLNLIESSKIIDDI